ncbi:hypothetical protein JCM15765_07650 [Paradesulfitobacterium aromaticivorans]
MVKGTDIIGARLQTKSMAYFLHRNRHKSATHLGHEETKREVQQALRNVILRKCKKEEENFSEKRIYLVG